MHINNFYLYFARFCRHYILTKEWEDILTFLDLTHSFRCLMDIKRDIDSVIDEKGCDLRFNHIINMRDIKRNALDGITILSETNTDSGRQSFMGVANTVIDIETLDKYKYIEPNYQTKRMSFTEWLGCEVAVIKEDEVFTINRETFIKRIANKFSGSHPYETRFDIDNNPSLELKHSYIDKIQATSISNYNYGYLIIQELAKEFIEGVINCLLLDESNVGYSVFQKCKEILTEE